MPSATRSEPQRPSTTLHGALVNVGHSGAWPRQFALVIEGDDGGRVRFEFTLHTPGVALYTIEPSGVVGLVPARIVGWLSWSRGQVVTAWRHTADGAHDGGFLEGFAPAETSSVDDDTFVERAWERLAEALLDLVAGS